MYFMILYDTLCLYYVLICINTIGHHWYMLCFHVCIFARTSVELAADGARRPLRAHRQDGAEAGRIGAESWGFP